MAHRHAVIARRATLLLGLALPAAAQAQGAPESIGTAEMKPDGTIVLRLVATGASGTRGHGTLEYSPGHPQYAMVLRHLGGLAPGEVKSVPPFPG